MRGIDLLYAIGQIEDRFIERAEKRSVIKTRRIKTMRIKTMCGFAVAACVLIAVITGVNYFNSTEKELVGELAPMVYVNSTLYIQDENLECYTEKEEDFLYVGKITSTVSSSSQPHEDFQANDDIIGASIYQYGKKIVVFYNEKYWVYRPYQE